MNYKKVILNSAFMYRKLECKIRKKYFLIHFHLRRLNSFSLAYILAIFFYLNSILKYQPLK
jgi:hypothetical protein